MIIIDGHNLIGAFDYLNFEDKNVYEKIFNKIHKYSILYNTKIILVFDGFKPENFSFSKKNKNIHVIFSDDQEADEIIIMLCEKFSHARDTVVVSSDNKIINIVKKNKLISKNCKFFASNLINAEDITNHATKESEYLNPLETEKWLKYFRKK